jgi:hypothetical protein
LSLDSPIFFGVGGLTRRIRHFTTKTPRDGVFVPTAGKPTEGSVRASEHAEHVRGRETGAQRDGKKMVAKIVELGVGIAALTDSRRLV